MPPSILRKTRSLTLTRLAEAVGGHRLSGDSDLDPNEGWGTGSFKKPQKGKLKGSARTVVNAVRFVRALSGVRNAGIHKTSSSSITSPSRTRLAPFPKGPDAASEILERWGGVKKLEQHWVGASGAQYLARCEKKTRWLTEVSPHLSPWLNTAVVYLQPSREDLTVDSQPPTLTGRPNRRF
jgi:hypothetical protein